MNLASRILSQSDRKWTAFCPATEEEIEKLLDSVNFELPQDFLDLLAFSNGGEGDINLPPMRFALDEISEIISLLNDDFYKTEFPHFMFFGGNGGLEMIAFDLRRNPYSVVMIDPIEGEKSAVEISINICEFINAIGIEYKEDA